MLTAEQNQRLTRVGPGTPMGELLRRYWHPIAPSAELGAEHPTKEVRLLGEDLVLYRDASGTPGLIEPSCAHRKANLSYGVPEPNGIRCAYHGWVFDETRPVRRPAVGAGGLEVQGEGTDRSVPPFRSGPGSSSPTWDPRPFRCCRSGTS